jgi:transposase-like protein
VAGKVPVFGLLKRGGLVYAVTIPSTKSSVLIGIICERTKPDSIIYSDALNAYARPVAIAPLVSRSGPNTPSVPILNWL